MNRPTPIEIKDHHLSVVRGPREDGRWYWRARTPARDTIWTGWATPGEAACALRERLNEPEPAPDLHTVADLLQLWLAARDRDPTVRETTKIVCIRQAHHLQRLLGAQLLSTLDESQQEHYRNTRLGEGAAPRSVLGELITLRAAWRWAIRCELLQATPMASVKVKLRGYVQNHHTPTEPEVHTVLAHMRGDELLAGQVLAITGARVSEVTGLRRCDVDLQRGVLHLNGKTGPRDFPLTAMLRQLLQDRAAPGQERLLALHKNSGKHQVWLALRRACEAAAVPTFSPHGLRRMAVNRLLRAGVEPKVAAALTGHSVRVMLKVYRQASDEDRVKGVRQAGLGRSLTRTDHDGQALSGSPTGA